MMRAGSDFSIIGSETSKERELGSDFDCLDDGARSIRSFVLSSEVCVEEVKERCEPIGQVKEDMPEVKAEDKPKEKSEEKPKKKLEEQPEKKVEVVPTESAIVEEKAPEGQEAADEQKPEEKKAEEEVKAPEETKTSEERKEEAPKEKEASKPKVEVKIVVESSEEQSAPLLVVEKKTNEIETNKLPAPIARSIFENAGEPIYTHPSSVLMEYGNEEPEERGPTFRERVQRWRRSIRQKIDYLTQENEYDDNPTLKEIIVDLWHKEIRGFTISRTTDFLCLLLPFCMLAVVFSAPENFLYTMLTICSIWVLWRWCCIPRPEKRRAGYRY